MMFAQIIGMTCEYQLLHFADDGYVVHCKHCKCYQISFISTMLTLTRPDFEALCKLVSYRCTEPYSSCAVHSKSIVIETPAKGICLLLTRNEAQRFSNMLDEADTEDKAQQLLGLF